MHDFGYHRPTSLDEAAHLSGVGDTALIAGGQTLITTLKLRRRRLAALVDLSAVLSRDIDICAGGLWIGAGATHALIAASRLVGDSLPALAALAHHVGDPAVRHRGTLGGALAANEPSGDYPVACLALDAIIHTTERDIPAPEFFTGHQRTALRSGEIITGVAFALARRASYLKLLDPASRYAMVGVFVGLTHDEPRVAVTGARHSGAARWPEAEERLRADFSSSRLHGLNLPLADTTEHLTTDTTYRAHLAGVLACRAIDSANGLTPATVAIAHGAPQPRPSSARRSPPADR